MRWIPIASWSLIAALSLAAGPAGAAEHEAAKKAEADFKHPSAGTPGATAEWEQAAVTAAAQEFVSALGPLRRETRNVPGVTVASMQSRSWHRFQDNLRVLEREAAHLVARLEAGASQDETYNVYARMWITVADLQEDARRMMIPQQVQNEINTARAKLDALDAFYD